MSEHDEQVAVIEWCKLHEGLYPELWLIYAVPNAGKRSKYQGARMKAEGLKKGVPDLCLPVARDGFHGLYIEMKIGRNKPTAYQQEWLDRISEQGYLATACWGFDDAIETIENYIKGSKDG